MLSMSRLHTARLRASLFTAAVLLMRAPGLCAQSAAPAAPAPASGTADRWHVTLTVFRSPGTGIQVGRGSLAVFVAHYPTILRRAANGDRPTTHFLRAGVAAYLRPEAGTSPYVSLSIAPSLSSDWTLSGLVDVGVRQRFTQRLSGQLGVAVLRAPKIDATRVNPTLGLGVSF